jgi:hypothetical protein
MGLDDLLNKAKEWAGNNPDKADAGVDKGTSALKEKFTGHEQQIESLADKAKDYLHGPGQQGKDAAQGQGEQKPPNDQPPPAAP